jgi:hypothetical protein
MTAREADNEDYRRVAAQYGLGSPELDALIEAQWARKAAAQPAFGGARASLPAFGGASPVPSLPSFSPPPAAAQPAPAPQAGPLPSFDPRPNQFADPTPIAPPPSTTFLEQAKVHEPAPMTPAGMSAVGPAPAPVPFVHGLNANPIQAQDYGRAPDMPGYAEARTGAPFRAPQPADLGNLFARIAHGASPFGLPGYDSDDLSALTGGRFL